ncbi:MAG: phosphatase family protein [Alphaproteobacteria bacterium]|nr:phosphatase family protein [Alphaproteobacteria bacterium]
MRNIEFPNYGIVSAALECGSPQTGLDVRGRTAESAFVSLSPDRRQVLIVLILAGLWLAMLTLGGPASAADAALLGLFHLPALAPAALLVTRLGEGYVLLPLSLLAAVWIAARRGIRPAGLYLLVVLSGRLLVELEKHVVGRPRPNPAGRLDTVVTMAFPSGHAANSMVAWLGLALLAAPARLRPAAVAAALALALLVGLTRLILAVHWPSDVIGGWAFGAAWTLLLLRIGEGTSPPFRH